MYPHDVFGHAIAGFYAAGGDSSKYCDLSEQAHDDAGSI